MDIDLSKPLLITGDTDILIGLGKRLLENGFESRKGVPDTVFTSGTLLNTQSEVSGCILILDDNIYYLYYPSTIIGAFDEVDANKHYFELKELKPKEKWEVRETTNNRTVEKDGRRIYDVIGCLSKGEAEAICNALNNMEEG